MPFGKADMQLIVGEDGTSESLLQPAVYLYNVSMKCDAGAVFGLRILDKDDYIIMDPGTQFEGPNGFNVERRLQNFKVQLYGATPGQYLIRGNIET